MAMDGVWRSVGYGWVLEIESGTARWFDDSPVGLLPIAPPGGGHPSAGLTVARDAIEYREPCGLTTIGFARIGSAPAMMTDAARTDPTAAFDVLWGTVRDHHAFLQTRGVDWEAVGAHHRPRACAASSDHQLFEILTATLSALGDGHASVDAPLAPSHARTPGLAETRGWITSHAVPAAQSFGAGQLVAGRIGDGVGYLGILRMEGFAPGALDAVEVEVANAAQAIDEALATLEGSTGVVIDLRGNTGGWDAVALTLLAPFIDEERALFTKCARSGAGTTAPEVVRLSPATHRRFPGGVVLLTGPLTASAAEVFTLASLVLPRSVRVGAATAGILSDELEKHLPNGWTFTLSNEIYADLSGHCPELVGLTPDIELDDGTSTTAEALADGLRRAVAVLADSQRGGGHVRR